MDTISTLALRSQMHPPPAGAAGQVTASLPSSHNWLPTAGPGIHSQAGAHRA